MISLVIQKNDCSEEKEFDDIELLMKCIDENDDYVLEILRIEKYDLDFKTLQKIFDNTILQKNLLSLELSRNNICETDICNISNLGRMHILEISCNNLKVIPSELTKLTRLEGLDVSYNNLTSLPKELTDMKVEIFVSGNDDMIFDASIIDKECILGDELIMKVENWREYKSLKNHDYCSQRYVKYVFPTTEMEEMYADYVELEKEKNRLKQECDILREMDSVHVKLKKENNKMEKDCDILRTKLGEARRELRKSIEDNKVLIDSNIKLVTLMK